MSKTLDKLTVKELLSIVTIMIDDKYINEEEFLDFIETNKKDLEAWNYSIDPENLTLGIW